MRVTTAAATAIAVAFLLLLAETPARAAVTCQYDDAADSLTVAAGADQDDALLGPGPGGEIVVLTLGGAIACTGAGGPPTVNNIGDLVMTGAAGEQRFFIQNPAGLAPGNGATGEIEVLAVAGGGEDAVQIVGTTGNDFYVLGAGGINWNGDMDADLTLLSVEAIGMIGGEGNDAITARGADGTGAPFAGPARFFGAGSAGNDVIEGGDAGDTVAGDEGDDTVRGFGGPDELSGDSGTNLVEGGPGEDVAGFLSAPGGVDVDLGLAGPQSTGHGTDTLNAVEGLSGSNFPDTLRGDGTANRLLGQDGDDTLEGRAGNDELNGGAGSNTATYALAPAGVTADLQLGTVSGGGGDDTLLGIDTLVGSEFADTIDGSASPDSITGLGGNDTIASLAGNDELAIRDGGPDTASCGADVDSAIADRASVDSVNADCETVDFLPEPGLDPGGGGEPVSEDRELAFELSGRARQRVLDRKGVVVRALCPLETCAAIVRGRRLRPREAGLGAGVVERIRLRLKRGQLAAIERALADGRRPKVRVRAEGTDAAGNVATDALTVTARG